MSDNICHICNNDGSCRNEDIYDCVEVWEEKNNILKGMWMVEWMKKSKKKDKKPTESDFVKWCKSLVIILLFTTGCGDISPNTNDIFLELSMDYPYDQNSEAYIVAYPTNLSHTYVGVSVRSNPMNRVYFGSPDEFGVYHQGRWFYEPIIQHSVYVKDDSSSQQLVYLNKAMIGRRLSVFAVARCVDGLHEIKDSLFFILQ